MVVAQGSVKCDGSRLVGSFVVGGSPRYLTADVKPLNQSFECKNATLTYDDITQLILDSNLKWTGTAGRNYLQMDFGQGVSVTGPFTVTRSSIRIHGTGSWSSVKSILPPASTNATKSNVSNVAPLDVIQVPAKVSREHWRLLDLGVPIIACAKARFRSSYGPLIVL